MGEKKNPPPKKQAHPGKLERVDMTKKKPKKNKTKKKNKPTAQFRI